MNRKEKKNNKSDAELVKDFMNSDIKAFDTLVVRYQDMIFNLCIKMLGDYDEATDAAQDTFIKTFRGLKGFEFKSNFSTWLYRISVNTCKNRMASSWYRARKKNVSIDDCGDPERGIRNDPADMKFNPERIVLKKEKEDAVLTAIDSLPEKQKILVVLRDIEGKSYEEITEITGITTGTVKSRIARAREQLRETLRGVL